MKISQLSAASGQSVSTIKFYIRRGLLPHGRVTAKNQATYDDSHVERLRLITILKDELHLRVDEMIEVLAALQPSPEYEHSFPHEGKEGTPAPEQARALSELHATARDMGWLVQNGNPSLSVAARQLAIILRLFPDVPLREALLSGAQAMSELAHAEIEVERSEGAAAWADSSRFVLMTLLFEPVLVELRRLARAQRRAQLLEMQRFQEESGQGRSS